MKKLHELSRFYARVIERAKIRKAKIVVARYRHKRNVLIRRMRHERAVIALRKRSKGFVWVDGVKVCGWIAEELQKARRYGWRGRVISGYRTPAYSEQLCYAMCGRPSCPGRCAGRATNHARGPEFPLGAVDVTLYWELQNICVKHGLRIHNGLPRTDPVHFSHAGN
jgi:hypothetical protein